jgi:hypothetical protein
MGPQVVSTKDQDMHEQTRLESGFHKTPNTSTNAQVDVKIDTQVADLVAEAESASGVHLPEIPEIPIDTQTGDGPSRPAAETLDVETKGGSEPKLTETPDTPFDAQVDVNVDTHAATLVAEAESKSEIPLPGNPKIPVDTQTVDGPSGPAAETPDVETKSIPEPRCTETADILADTQVIIDPGATDLNVEIECAPEVSVPENPESEDTQIGDSPVRSTAETLEVKTKGGSEPRLTEPSDASTDTQVVIVSSDATDLNEEAKSTLEVPLPENPDISADIQIIDDIGPGTAALDIGAENSPESTNPNASAYAQTDVINDPDAETLDVETTGIPEPKFTETADILADTQVIIDPGATDLNVEIECAPEVSVPENPESEDTQIGDSPVRSTAETLEVKTKGGSEPRLTEPSDASTDTQVVIVSSDATDLNEEAKSTLEVPLPENPDISADIQIIDDIGPGTAALDTGAENSPESRNPNASAYAQAGVINDPDTKTSDVKTNGSPEAGLPENPVTPSDAQVDVNIDTHATTLPAEAENNSEFCLPGDSDTSIETDVPQPQFPGNKADGVLSNAQVDDNSNQHVATQNVEVECILDARLSEMEDPPFQFGKPQILQRVSFANPAIGVR